MSPRIDVLENKKEIRIDLDVAGAAAVNTFVYRETDVSMSIYVRKKAVPEAYTPIIEELPPCDWYRMIALPDEVAASVGRATVKVGVLTIRIPKQRRRYLIGTPVQIEA
jgi:HSP20 family molecular chaperone IbpA